MSLEPGSRQGNASPLSSGRSSPIPHRRKNTYDGISRLRNMRNKASADFDRYPDQEGSEELQEVCCRC